MEVVLKIVVDSNLTKNDIKNIIHSKVVEALTGESNNVSLDLDKYSKEDYIEIAEVNLSR